LFFGDFVDFGEEELELFHAFEVFEFTYFLLTVTFGHLLQFILDTDKIVIHEFFLFGDDNKVGNPVFLKLIKTDTHGNNILIVFLFERHPHLFSNHVQVKHSQ
jgi:hypothetical protein